MGIEIDNLKCLTAGGWGLTVKRCDSCKTAAATVFCRVDSSFLCLNCDNKIHFVNKIVLRHERVWICEVCEQAPAAVTCKADAAALCVTCDADIHSANPLARRHERVPVEPFFDSADTAVKTSPFSFQAPNPDEVEGVSWLLPSTPDINPKLNMGSLDLKLGDQFFPVMDSFLNFDYQNSIDGRFQQSAGTDSVVPVHAKPSPILIMNNNQNCLDIDLCRSKLTSFNYSTQSLSHSVSPSSLDVGVVPDCNSMSEISYPFSRNVSSTGTGSDPSVPVSSTAANQATQLCGLDREARVLRYREKRKNRKFEKTIRYASRKAYAETRPRIKGRFAKRTDNNIESDMDHLYNTSVPFMMDNQYGVVVPSF